MFRANGCQVVIELSDIEIQYPLEKVRILNIGVLNKQPVRMRRSLRVCDARGSISFCDLRHDCDDADDENCADDCGGYDVQYDHSGDDHSFDRALVRGYE